MSVFLSGRPAAGTLADKYLDNNKKPKHIFVKPQSMSTHLCRHISFAAFKSSCNKNEIIACAKYQPRITMEQMKPGLK
jgi:hypothetical protein